MWWHCPHGKRALLSPVSLLTRPLTKLHIIWKKKGVPVASGISDYNRHLTILNPTLSDSGYYECEAVLRSSSVPSVIKGAYLSVLGKDGDRQMGNGRKINRDARGSKCKAWNLMILSGVWQLAVRKYLGLRSISKSYTSRSSTNSLKFGHSCVWVFSHRATPVYQWTGEAHHSWDGKGGSDSVPSQRYFSLTDQGSCQSSSSTSYSNPSQGI